MGAQIPAGIEAWIAALSAAEVPVLARSVKELAALKQREDEVTPREISAAVLRDPLLTLRVLRYIESRRRPGQPADITTIEHALMMLGATPFFKSCEQLPTVESQLRGNPQALAGYMRVVSRAHHAAVYARSWAAYRRDSESDEVIVAALLHDLAEMLLWCAAPEAALEVQTLLEQEPGLRSADAQQRVLGIKLHDLQLALCAAWKLPALLRDLMDDQHANVGRVKNVVLAVALARHSAHGWHDLALPDDYNKIAGFLKMPVREACERVARLAFAAAASEAWYGVPGTAALLPASIPYGDRSARGEAAGQVTGEAEGEAPRGIEKALERAQEKLSGALLGLLPSCHAAQEGSKVVADATHALVGVTVHALHDELALPRVMFAALAAHGDAPRLAAVALAGPEVAALRAFALPVSEPNLFAQLIERGGAVQVAAGNREEFAELLTPELLASIGEGEFIATAVKAPGRNVLGVLYADRGAGSSGIAPASFNAFKCTARFLAACIGKLNDPI